MPLTYALFEIAADLGSTVKALNESGYERSCLAFIARDLESDLGEQDDRNSTITQVLQALDLTTIANKFDPLALVVVPGGGAFLIGGWPTRNLGSGGDSSHSNRAGIHRLLGDLGHSDDEAEFLDSRLQAGALFLGVSSSDEDVLLEAREIFADHQAVHVGIVAFELLQSDWEGAAVPALDSVTTGEVVIVDVTAGLIDTDSCGPSSALTGATVIDETDQEVGTVTAGIFPLDRETGWPPAYVVIERGGFLGIGQNLYVLPYDIVEVSESEIVRIRCSVDVIENAPAFDARLPFSRREEQAVCAYYGTKPYWERDQQRGGTSGYHLQSIRSSDEHSA